MNYDKAWVELEGVKMLSIAAGSRQVRQYRKINKYIFFNFYSQLDGLYGAASITIKATASDLLAFCFGGKFMTGKFIEEKIY